MSNPEQILREKGYYAAVVHGHSMTPLLVNHRDAVYIEKADELHKYDVVLFRRTDGQLVLHRVLGIKGDRLTVCGDNDVVKETIDRTQVIGVMKEFARKGTVMSVRSRRYRLYSRVWNASFPTKRVLRWMYRLIASVRRKSS